ncbi:MAG: GtrA family protein [Dysgonamonadaceae bacterium]|jgi:putative flippase GtrA|nr:GtrA family protein [Dysgonamonadaceae bacterium]
MRNQWIGQAFRYGIVGILNTLLTAAVIWFMMRFVFGLKGEQDAAPEAVSLSNITGYAAGIINSFIWNRKWTFKSQKNWRIDFFKFTGAFFICYLPQLLLVMILNGSGIVPTLRFGFPEREYVLSSPYTCQLAGIVFFTLLNFLCNKYYTFK